MLEVRTGDPEVWVSRAGVYRERKTDAEQSEARLAWLDDVSQERPYDERGADADGEGGREADERDEQRETHVRQVEEQTGEAREEHR